MLVDLRFQLLFYLITYHFFSFTEIIKKQGDEGVPDLVHVMRTLASESIPNLPPGGELASKWVSLLFNSISANIDKWGFSDDNLKFQTISNTITIFLLFRRTVIEAVYNKLNPYRSDDTVSIQTFFFCHFPFSFAWLVIRMAFDKWPAFLTGCLHPFNKISKPYIFLVKWNDSKIDSEKSCCPILWYTLSPKNLQYFATTFQYIKTV